jgi:hypothetical protein
VCEIIKKQGKQDSQLINAVGQLLGLGLSCSPVLFGPAAATMLPLLGVNDDASRSGRRSLKRSPKPTQTTLSPAKYTSRPPTACWCILLYHNGGNNSPASKMPRNDRPPRIIANCKIALTLLFP